MKSILITGASGLVGTATIEKLLACDDYYIFAASSKKLYSSDSRLKYIDNNEIEKVISENRVDVILQLAFPRNVTDDKWADGLEFVANIIALAKKYKIKKFINVSSQSIYGWKREKPASENDNVILNSPYTTGKYFSEIMVSKVLDDIDFTNVRLATIIGPTSEERVVNKFFMQILDGKNLAIKGGNQVFSFLDVRDAASGLVELIKSCSRLRPVYNLGTSENMTLLDIAKSVIDIAKNKGYFVDLSVINEEILLNNSMDVSLMYNDFGWSPRYTMKESMTYIFECIINRKV